MPIYQTAHYQVNPGAVDKVKAAIAEFVEYVTEHEPGTRVYTAWQQQDDPTKFVHLFEFADEDAHNAHGASAAVRRFATSLSVSGSSTISSTPARPRRPGTPR